MKSETLYNLIAKYKILSESLDCDEIDIDEILQLAQTEITEKVDRCLIVHKDLENSAQFYKERAKAFSEKAKTIQNEADRLKEYVKNSLIEVNLTNIETTNFPSVKVISGAKKVEINNEEELREWAKESGNWENAFLAKYSPCKSYLKTLLEEESIPGCVLTDSVSLRVK